MAKEVYEIRIKLFVDPAPETDEEAEKLGERIETLIDKLNITLPSQMYPGWSFRIEED